MKIMNILMIFAVLAAAGTAPLHAAEPAAAPAGEAEPMFLTVFLRHDQSKTLDEINAHLEKTGFWKKFPPQGIEIVSWQVMMGIGHVITLRVPPSRLREVNLAVEKNAWGAFRSEFYPSYDFLPVYETNRRKAAAGGAPE